MCNAFEHFENGDSLNIEEEKIKDFWILDKNLQNFLFASHKSFNLYSTVYILLLKLGRIFAVIYKDSKWGFLHKIFFENFNCRAFYKFNLFGIDCSASSKRNYSDSSSYRCILHNVKALLEGENSWCNQFSMFNERRRFSVKRENMVAEIAENRYIYWHNGTASLSLEYLPSCPSLFLHKDNFLLNTYLLY